MRSSKKKSLILEKGKSIDLFRTMIDSCPVWISFVNADGRYLIANDYYTKTFNLPLSQVEGHNFKEFFPPGLYVKHKQLIDMCFQKGEPIEWEDQHNFKKKQTVYIYGIYTPLINDDGSKRGIVAFGLDITKLKQTEIELIKEKKNLEEVNAALRIVLREHELRKTEIEEKIFLNIEKLLLPYLNELESTDLNEKQHFFLDVIQKNIQEITSSFAKDLTQKYNNLTPREIQVANLIKQGRANKEIAKLLAISPSAVDFHRQSLRKKLNIKGKKKNLRTILLDSQF